MNVNTLRAQLPTGADRRVKLRTRNRPLPTATVVEHTADGVYLGVHPDLLFVKYAEVEEVMH